MKPFLTCSSPPHRLHRSPIVPLRRPYHRRRIWVIYAHLKPCSNQPRDATEQVEMTEPRKALDAAGAETSIVSPKRDRVRAWKFTEWGDEYPVDVPLDGARPGDFDALLLPGGVINPEALRMQPAAVAFAKAFFDAGKPVATICHGPWTIIEAGAAPRRAPGA